jgi:hypothetical protein
MSGKPDYLRKKFAPLQDKTLHQALAHVMGKEFPRLGGPRFLDLCAELVLKVVAEHVRPREHIQHGQVLWMGVSKDDPPRRRQRIADTDLVPVVLDLSISEDIEARLDRQSPGERLRQKAVRLCEQAYRQGALLSNCDLAEMLNKSDADIAHTLGNHERGTGKLVPRRATLHDVGTGLTHKQVICRKYYAEGKTAGEVARETYHSLEAVDRYLGQFDRVRHCRREGMGPEAIAFTLNCSPALVQEYLKIDDQLEAGHD